MASIIEIITENKSLNSLNLEGLMLASALVQLAPVVKENRTLCYLNISNNGIMAYEQEWFLQELSVPQLNNPASISAQDILF